MNPTHLLWIPALFIAASLVLSARNIHAFWGSWEPLKRAIKPNKLRPVVYVPRHGSTMRLFNRDARRANDLTIELFMERAWHSTGKTLKLAIESGRGWATYATGPLR